MKLREKQQPTTVVQVFFEELKIRGKCFRIKVRD
jgi:hypothetical protein